MLDSVVSTLRFGWSSWVSSLGRKMRFISLLCVNSMSVIVFRGRIVGVSCLRHRPIVITMLSPTISISADQRVMNQIHGKQGSQWCPSKTLEAYSASYNVLRYVGGLPSRKGDVVVSPGNKSG